MPSQVKMDFLVADFPSLLFTAVRWPDGTQKLFLGTAIQSNAHALVKALRARITKRDLVEADVMGVRRPPFSLQSDAREFDF